VELRLLDFSRDLTPLGEMICNTFQYPENPEWSVQTDEKEDIARRAQLVSRAKVLSTSREDRMLQAPLSVANALLLDSASSWYYCTCSIRICSRGGARCRRN